MAFGYNKGRDKKANNTPIAASGAVTMLGVGTLIEGNIKLSGDVRIDGVVKGSVEGKNKVVVGEKGKVLGNVICGSLDLHGKIEGNVKSEKTARLHSSAVLKGDLFAPKFSVEMGAIFVGVSKGQKIVSEREQDENENKKNK